jgi:hypothetical protein
MMTGITPVTVTFLAQEIPRRAAPTNSDPMAKEYGVELTADKD